uniref:BAH domain-containing protein n=1 Tax=Ditylenchus dipsaci TaxID=166011 RepID=A0A915D3M5_9BILA
MPKSQLKGLKSTAEEEKEDSKTNYLLASVNKKKKNRELERLTQDSEINMGTPKSRFASLPKILKKEAAIHERRKKKGLKIVSNWRPVGSGFYQAIRIANDSSAVHRHCFHSIRHWAEKEEIIRVRDCVKICSSEGLENIGRIMHLHYDESSKGLMATVLWFYTQMQVDTSKGLSTTEMLDKELLASRHIDTVNVDCIESLAFVLTVNEFCRFSAETKIDQLPVQRRPSEASELWSRGEQVYPRRSLLPHEDTPLELVYFCRGVYSLKTKRLSLSLPSASYHQQSISQNSEEKVRSQKKTSNQSPLIFVSKSL